MDALVGLFRHGVARVPHGSELHATAHAVLFGHLPVRGPDRGRPLARIEGEAGTAPEWPPPSAPAVATAEPLHVLYFGLKKACRRAMSPRFDNATRQRSPDARARGRRRRAYRCGWRRSAAMQWRHGVSGPTLAPGADRPLDASDELFVHLQQLLARVAALDLVAGFRRVIAAVTLPWLASGHRCWARLQVRLARPAPLAA